MKTITSKLKLAAIAGIALIAIFSINSCKKSSSSPATPTVTSITLTSGATLTAGTSTGFTITGVNLTGATVTATASGVTITGITVTGSTSITGTVAVNASFQSGTVTLTITTSIGSTTTTFTVVGLTPLGDFISSDSVASSNLIAYWPFNGNVNDTAGGIAGTAVNVTYVPGVRGQAYQGSSTSYASFTPSAAMAGLQSFSVSVWFWQVAQPSNSPNDPQGIFFLADANGADPLILLENEHYAPASGDSLQIHSGLTFTTAKTYNGFTMTAFDTAGIGKWVHQVMTYDGGSSTYTIYQDGLPILNNSAYGLSTSAILLDGPTGSTPQGNLNWAATPPVEGTIGTWAPGVYGVSPTLGANGNWQGKIDELRLFSKALSQKEVTGLYLNGLAGR